MDVFALRQSLVGDYESFARSFTSIRADDIREHVDTAYANGRFWPEPLIQKNSGPLWGVGQPASGSDFTAARCGNSWHRYQSVKACIGCQHYCWIN